MVSCEGLAHLGSVLLLEGGCYMAVVGNPVACMEGAMNPRVKTWLTEDEILAAIDRTKRLAQRRLEQSKKFDEAAKEKFGKCEALRFELMGKPDHSLEEKLRVAELSAAATKEKADIAAKAYHCAVNSTLPRLGEILSAFRTGTMPEILDEYKGVAVK